MNVRVTVEFAKAETIVSRFVFICNREQDLGAGMDVAVAFFRRQHPQMSLFDESVCLLFIRNSLRRALAPDRHPEIAPAHLAAEGRASRDPWRPSARTPPQLVS
jgi:hypothetical protein